MSLPRQTGSGSSQQPISGKRKRTGSTREQWLGEGEWSDSSLQEKGSQSVREQKSYQPDNEEYLLLEDNFQPGLMQHLDSKGENELFWRDTSSLHRINVKSFDFDGCLFNTAVHECKRGDMPPSQFLENNKVFIQGESAKVKNRKINEVISFIGSNRQSIPWDYHMGGRGYGSCFPALIDVTEAFSKELRSQKVFCHYNPYLLADTYGGVEPGTNFNRIMENNPELAQSYYLKKKSRPENYNTWIFDSSKLSVIYAQMHFMALTRPNTSILFDFYDDKKDEILLPLKKFFLANPDLIPSNVQLSFNEYNGGKVVSHKGIHGTGGVDKNFEETIKFMAMGVGATRESFAAVEKAEDPADASSRNFLTHFSEQRNLEALKKQRTLEQTVDKEREEKVISRPGLDSGLAKITSSPDSPAMEVKTQLTMTSAQLETFKQRHQAKFTSGFFYFFRRTNVTRFSDYRDINVYQLFAHAEKGNNRTREILTEMGLYPVKRRAS